MSDHPPYSFVQWALPRFHRALERQPERLPPAAKEKINLPAEEADWMPDSLDETAFDGVFLAS